MTIVEVEAKKTNLEAEMATALEAAKVLTPATAEFDDAYGRYLAAKANLFKIPEEIAKAKTAENAGAISAAGDTTAEAITQLVDGLKVADLLGVPVIALRYTVDAAGKAGVIFNPIVKVKAAGGGTKRTPGTGRTVIVDPEGNRLSLTKFVLAYATDAEKATPEYKYPHGQVDSKPKFEAFCLAHSLTGFTYETASNAPAEVEAS